MGNPRRTRTQTVKRKGASTKQPMKSGRHIRVTLEIDRRSSRILDVRVIERKWSPSKIVVGPLICQVRQYSQVVSTDSFPDPFEIRGFGGTRNPEHSYRKSEREIITAKVPLRGRTVPTDLSIDLLWGGEGLPSRTTQLKAMMKRPDVRNQKTFSTLKLQDLRKLPNWKKVLTEAGIKDPLPNSRSPTKPRRSG